MTASLSCKNGILTLLKEKFQFRNPWVRKKWIPDHSEPALYVYGGVSLLRALGVEEGVRPVFAHCLLVQHGVLQVVVGEGVPARLAQIWRLLPDARELDRFPLRAFFRAASLAASLLFAVALLERLVRDDKRPLLLLVPAMIVEAERPLLSEKHAQQTHEHQQERHQHGA